MAEDSRDLLTQARQRAKALGEALRARDAELGQYPAVESAMHDAIAATARAEAALEAAVQSRDQQCPAKDDRA